LRGEAGNFRAEPDQTLAAKLNQRQTFLHQKDQHILALHRRVQPGWVGAMVCGAIDRVAGERDVIRSRHETRFNSFTPLVTR